MRILILALLLTGCATNDWTGVPVKYEEEECVLVGETSMYCEESRRFCVLRQNQRGWRCRPA